MSSLFPELSPLPEGFSYFPGVISPEEEEALLAHIAGIPLRPFVFQGYTAKRRVASFGPDWSFEDRVLRPGQDIPEVLLPVIRMVAEHLAVPPEAFREVLVTEYPPGSVIDWHRDAPPFELVAGLSLGADCLFRLRPWPHVPGRRAATVQLPLARRSLYGMQGAARWAWQHSIRPVASTRYSITFRTLKTEFPP